MYNKNEKTTITLETPLSIQEFKDKCKAVLEQNDYNLFCLNDMFEIDFKCIDIADKDRYLHSRLFSEQVERSLNLIIYYGKLKENPAALIKEVSNTIIAELVEELPLLKTRLNEHMYEIKNEQYNNKRRYNDKGKNN